jgi:hypothetical protein
MSIYIYRLSYTHTDSGIHVGLQEGNKAYSALEIALENVKEAIALENDTSATREAVAEALALLEEHMAKGGEEEAKELQTVIGVGQDVTERKQEEEEERVVCRDCKSCWCSRRYAMGDHEEVVEEGDAMAGEEEEVEDGDDDDEEESD